MTTRIPRQSTVQDRASAPALAKAEFERLAELRYALRQFSRQTELEARRVGLTPQQYFLLLAIKGFPGRDVVNITELAERLQIRHNAVIGLINRAEERDLVRREPDQEGDDRRIVFVRLTDQGEMALQQLAAALRGERQRVRAALSALEALDEDEQRAQRHEQQGYLQHQDDPQRKERQRPRAD